MRLRRRISLYRVALADESQRGIDCNDEQVFLFDDASLFHDFGCAEPFIEVDGNLFGFQVPVNVPLFLWHPKQESKMAVAIRMFFHVMKLIVAAK